MKHEPLTGCGWALALLAALLIIGLLLFWPPSAGGQGAYPPPVMWTATPRPVYIPTSRPYRTPTPACCHVYAPAIERGK